MITLHLRQGQFVVVDVLPTQGDPKFTILSCLLESLIYFQSSQWYLKQMLLLFPFQYRTYEQAPVERIGGNNIGNQMLKVY